MSTRPSRRRLLAALLTLPLAGGLAACGDDSSGDDAATDTSAESSTAPVDLRLGYFPNLTHAPALVGVQNGIFEEHLPATVTLEPLVFNAGPEAVDALFAGDLDITYIGPNPAINAFAQSDGEAVRIIAGSTSGGAALVVRDGIESLEQLAGATIATPSLGNTQDVAARSYFGEEGLAVDEDGGVFIAPTANGDALAAFVGGQLDGGWVPEPFATRFVQEGNGHVLVDEADLWPGGRFVTTHIIVRTEFLDEHPDVVEAFLQGHLAALEAIEADPAAAQAAANAEIEALTDKRLDDTVLAAAWENLEFTADPIASSLAESAADAEAVGLLDPVDLDDIYDLAILNRLLGSSGGATVEGL